MWNLRLYASEDGFRHNDCDGGGAAIDVEETEADVWDRNSGGWRGLKTMRCKQ
jgi:hypothetical protein